MAVLTELARPLAQGECLPVRIAALRHIAEMAIVNDHVTNASRWHSQADRPPGHPVTSPLASQRQNVVFPRIRR